MTKREKYSKEFKLDAIALIVEQNYSQAEASRNLGVILICGVVGSKKLTMRMTKLFVAYIHRPPLRGWPLPFPPVFSISGEM